MPSCMHAWQWGQPFRIGFGVPWRGIAS